MSKRLAHALVLIALFSFVTVACRTAPTPTPVVYADTVNVADREKLGVPIAAQTLNRIVGSITVLPLNTWYPLSFVVKDPFGNVILTGGEVIGERSFAVIAAVNGNYYMHFDNSADFKGKTVIYSVTVHHR